MHIIGILYAIGAGVFFGFIGPLTKIAYNLGAGVGLAIILRYIIASILITPAIFINKPTLNIYKGDMTVLEPNVCFHMIAVMQFGDWGVEASESIRVTEKCSELFCNFSRELHLK